MAADKSSIQEKETAENALLFMLTGKTPAQLNKTDINQHIEKAWEISRAFHAFDPEAKS